jgi:proteasome lid subunit RPN8/RPN11
VLMRLRRHLTTTRLEPASQRNTPRLLLTEACLQQIRACLQPEIQKGHEGIVYLFGRTDGIVTLAVSVFRPAAETTRGSFFVESRAMAAPVRLAARFGLQIVAQVHTHPGAAFHSDGDVAGAKIRYSGYSSLVIPSFGRNLPHLSGVAAYMFVRDERWVLLDPSSLVIVPANAL